MSGIVAHNCRSTTIPKLATFRELGLDIDELPPGTRASAYGPVASDLSFDDWLKKQPRANVDDLLGKGRADLFLGGKMTLTQLIDPRTLKPLSLAELRAL